MLTRKLICSASAFAFTLTLSACGGGGGGGTVGSMPPPPTTPPPPPPPPSSSGVPEGANTALDIIDNAPTGNLAVAGVNAPNWGDANPNLSLATGDQPQMHYDAATNTYEIQFAGKGWETLWTKDTSRPDWARQVGVGVNDLTTIAFNEDRQPNGADAYPYSVLAGYTYPVNGIGAMAFGVPTPAGAVPITGAANYDGMIGGISDIYGPGFGIDPYPTLLAVVGTVTLSFNFASGSLSGAMKPAIGSDSLGVFTFKNAVYSAGAYSGQFDSSAAGKNGFYGQLTGPDAQELIGAWALPFHYAEDGKDHQAMGAWIAKRP